jgi:quercetin dioxygenase-like cupin family protein
MIQSSYMSCTWLRNSSEFNERHRTGRCTRPQSYLATPYRLRHWAEAESGQPDTWRIMNFSHAILGVSQEETMRNLLVLCVLVLFLTPAVFAQDPTVVAPGKYVKLFENDRVRVLEVNMKPGEKIPTHSHPAHVAWVATAGQLTITDASGKPMVADAKASDVFWFDPVTHSAENTGKTDLKVVVVELKK